MAETYLAAGHLIETYLTEAAEDYLAVGCQEAVDLDAVGLAVGCLLLMGRLSVTSSSFSFFSFAFNCCSSLQAFPQTSHCRLIDGDINSFDSFDGGGSDGLTHGLGGAGAGIKPVARASFIFFVRSSTALRSSHSFCSSRLTAAVPIRRGPCSQGLEGLALLNWYSSSSLPIPELTVVRGSMLGPLGLGGA